jgi:hypothetical protein
MNSLAARIFLTLSLLVSPLLVSSAGSASVKVEKVKLSGLRDLIRARSSKELSTRINQDKASRRIELVCDVQLRTGRVPSGCFTLLSQTEGLQPEAWLTELCIKRARNSHNSKELETALANPALPKKCSEVAQLRMDDLFYNEQEERPGELLHRRLHSAKQD